MMQANDYSNTIDSDVGDSEPASKLNENESLPTSGSKLIGDKMDATDKHGSFDTFDELSSISTSSSLRSLLHCSSGTSLSSCDSFKKKIIFTSQQDDQSLKSVSLQSLSSINSTKSFSISSYETNSEQSWQFKALQYKVPFNINRIRQRLIGLKKYKLSTQPKKPIESTINQSVTETLKLSLAEFQVDDKIHHKCGGIEYVDGVASALVNNHNARKTVCIVFIFIISIMIWEMLKLSSRMFSMS
ncbi:hypothetical protein DERF_008215 [Dermatophagoides farinae]|uniref:Uncharacterized protein n=1 Tax=Dermatophagoides farinae TaxID=6954 RepID=A0A922I1Y6_DERFA|nr:hypothetical protein HUG17_2405 [Dermatophagoides farinae]KAH9517545.1 hypothetical protein DERF_008215 [Dermatophagoides farinae]